MKKNTCIIFTKSFLCAVSFLVPITEVFSVNTFDRHYLRTPALDENYDVLNLQTTKVEEITSSIDAILDKLIYLSIHATTNSYLSNSILLATYIDHSEITTLISIIEEKLLEIDISSNVANSVANHLLDFTEALVNYNTLITNINEELEESEQYAAVKQVINAGNLLTKDWVTMGIAPAYSESWNSLAALYMELPQMVIEVSLGDSQFTENPVNSLMQINGSNGATQRLKEIRMNATNVIFGLNKRLAACVSIYTI